MFRFTEALPLGLYVHLPWCAKKCPYCDFNSHASREPLPETEYVEALLADLACDIPRTEGRPLRSIFIGGGTPSLFSPRAIEVLLDGIGRRMRIDSDAEITLEANPGTVEQARFQAYREAGINRLSIGIQSFNDAMLTALGRIHDGRGARRAVEAATRAGFDNLNLDLMFGLPGQTLAMARDDLTCALDLAPAHISYYQLTLEPNTAFHARPPALPDEDTIWAMQMHGQGILHASGYTQYEVSAYAQPDSRCWHNLNYWQFGDYLGIGAGAHGKIALLGEQRLMRLEKPRQPRGFMQNPSVEVRDVYPPDAAFEFMLNALRLTHGVRPELFTPRTGAPFELIDAPLQQARRDGLCAADATVIRPTELGRRFLNDLTARFLPET